MFLNYFLNSHSSDCDEEDDFFSDSTAGRFFPTEFGGNLPVPLGRLSFIKKDVKVVGKRNYLIQLAALCAIRAYKDGVPDFRVDTKVDGAELDHVVLSYGKKEGDSFSGRATRIYIVENIGGEDSKTRELTSTSDKNSGRCRLEKYFDVYRKVKTDVEDISGGDGIDSFVVCSDKRFRQGENIGHYVFDPSNLVNAGKDDLLPTDLMRFEDNFEGIKDLVACLKYHRIDGKVELAGSDSGTENSGGQKVFKMPPERRRKVDEIEKGKCPCEVAKQLAGLMAANPETKMLRLGESDGTLRKHLVTFADRVFVRVAGGFAFSGDFYEGRNLEWGSLAFRERLKDSLGNSGMEFDAIMGCTIQSDDFGLSEDGGASKGQEAMDFLKKMKIHFDQPGHESLRESLEAEMSICLHKTIGAKSTDEFTKLVSGEVGKGVFITEATVKAFLDKEMRDYGAIYSLGPANPRLHYISKERDIFSTCFCLSCRSGMTRGDRHAAGARPETPRSPDGQDAYSFALEFLRFNHECLVRALGEADPRTRAMRMNLAYVMTVTGQYGSALDLAEGEIDRRCGAISSEISIGFLHVKGRALLGLGRDEESVEPLVSGCAELALLSDAAHEVAFKATINIVYDLATKGRHVVAGKILDRLLTACLNTGINAGWASRERSGFGNAFPDLRLCYDVRTMSPRILAGVVYQWFKNEGGSKKEALEILKIIHKFFKAFLGEDDFDTLQVRMVFAQIYCADAKGLALKKGLQYLQDLHESLCKVVGSDGDSSLELLEAVHVEMLKAGGKAVAMKAMKQTLTLAKKKLKNRHPFIKKLKKTMFLLRP